MTGEGKTRGRTALLEIEANCNQSCGHIVKESEDISILFLWEFLNSRYWFIRSIRYGGGQPGVNTTLIKKLEISYPSLPEQERMLKKIEKMRYTLPKWFKHFEIILDGINHNIKSLDFIPQQILNDIFLGKTEK